MVITEMNTHIVKLTASPNDPPKVRVWDVTVVFADGEHVPFYEIVSWCYDNDKSAGLRLTSNANEEFGFPSYNIKEFKATPNGWRDIPIDDPLG